MISNDRLVRRFGPVLLRRSGVVVLHVVLVKETLDALRTEVTKLGCSGDISGDLMLLLLLLLLLPSLSLLELSSSSDIDIHRSLIVP
jgi:hypothetical protein